MRSKLTFGPLFLVVVIVVFIIIATSLAGFLATLSAEEYIFFSRLLEKRVAFPVLSTILVIAVIGYSLHLLFQKYINPLRRLVEETVIISTVNPKHRIEQTGSKETQQLTNIINSFADQYQQLQDDIKGKIRHANKEIEEEKNRLAALMSELTQGVLVCNIEGQILLYNKLARSILSPPGTNSRSNGNGAFIGLGRSIFSLIDRNLIIHALEKAQQRLHKQKHALSSFVSHLPAGQLARFQMIPVLDHSGELNGFILTCEDITRRVEVENHRDLVLQSLTEGMRASLGSIRAAIETILEYPRMEEERRKKFKRIIREESVKLGDLLDESIKDYSRYLKSQWPLEDIQSDDLLVAIKKRFESKFDVKVNIRFLPEPIWLKIDSYSILQALAFVMNHLHANFGIDSVTLQFQPDAKFAKLQLLWQGTPCNTEILRKWENQALVMDGQGSPLTLKDVIERHSSELWCRYDEENKTAYFSLLLPVTKPETELVVEARRESRPEFYDFDLFNRQDQKPELESADLAELSYVVFDTETTGLNPSDGDEIISIGAVRIVNGKILYNETFDQLIDPRRRISTQSRQITGIDPAMLEGQPTIDRVLPRFHNYVENSVLVAHNAAFDMRFLQLKEKSTGIKFTNPILDTLLLSAIIHPNQDQHNLESIARRLGITIFGRHTALGDAIVTAEVFLKLISLLKEKNITTFGRAQEAARESWYARIKY